MRRRNVDRLAYADLVLLVGLGILAGLSVVPGLVGMDSQWLSLLRIAVVGLFLLFAPGYALVAVLFRSEEDLSILERTVFSVGASLALVALVGVVLDQFPPGVTVGTVLASQVGLVALLALVAAVRRRRAGPKSIGYRRAFDQAWHGRNAIGGGHRALQAALVVTVVLTIGATAYAVTQPLPSERYSELYLLGADGTVDGVPETVAPGDSVNVTVGVYGHEHRTSSMGMQAQVLLPDGEREVVWTESMSLSHDETVERRASVAMPSVEAGSRLKVEVLLFRGSADGSPVAPEEAYRSVHTWVTVEETTASSSLSNTAQVRRES